MNGRRKVSDLLHASERMPTVGSGTETRIRIEWVEAEQKLAASRGEQRRGEENKRRMNAEEGRTCDGH
jgi:hypothetical protein